MYDILMIFVEIFHDFGWFFATRIRLTKMKRIQTDPDPHHWFKLYNQSEEITYFETLTNCSSAPPTYNDMPLHIISFLHK